MSHRPVIEGAGGGGTGGGGGEDTEATGAAACIDLIHRGDRPWVVLGSADEATRGRLGRLLEGPWGIGAVVPMVCDARGRTLEAGAEWRHDRLVDRRLGTDDPAAAATAADVDGSASAGIAFRRSLLAGTPMGPAAGAHALARSAAAAARARGLRVVYEPSWRVTSPLVGDRLGPGPERSPARPARAHRSDVLVVTGFVPASNLRDEDREVDSLIGELADLGAIQVTVAVLDGFLADRGSARLRAAGIEVVAGPQDWPAWFAARAGRFDAVIATRSSLMSPVEGWVASTQPQATFVLHLETLPSREMEAFRPACRPAELPGLDDVVRQEGARLADLARRSDVVVCTHADDADLVHGLVPERAVLVLAPKLPDLGGGGGFATRAGMAVLASDGHDVVAANEAAALRVIEEIAAPMRSLGVDHPLTILSDAPSPALSTGAAEVGARIAGLAEAGPVIAGSRIVVAAHLHGTGGRAAVLAALATGTPVIATPLAAAGLALDSDLRSSAVVGDPTGMRRAVRLALGDEGTWARLRDGVVRSAGAVDDAGGRRAALASVLRSAGMDPGAAPRRWPAPDPLRPSLGRPRVPPPMLRPLSPGVGYTPDLQATDGADESDSDARYRRWAGRHGPTPAVLEALAASVAAMVDPPTFSVVMPAWETPPHLLHAAIDSLRAQVYPHWELCIADDGSARADTRDALDSVAQDPRVKVVRLAGNSGIAAATNAALAAATGDYVAFMDHDDELKAHALAQVARWIKADPELDVIYSDEDKLDPDGRLVQPHLKPDYSPDLLMACNYMSHLTVARRSLVDAVGGLRPELDGSQDYDLLLRLVERTDRIGHIPEPLYSWRMVPGSAAGEAEAKPYALVAARRAVTEALERRGRPGTVETSALVGVHRARYRIPGSPRVSIVIPTRDRIDLLAACVESIFQRSTYANFEVVVVDNDSTEASTLGWLAHSGVRVIRYPHQFNYARQLNLAAASLTTDALLFLNNDTVVRTPGWIEALLEHAMRPEVGAVGGRLYFPDGRVQHEGIVVGVGGWALNVDHRDYFARGSMVRNASAVTGACTMVRPTVYARVGGNDEGLRIAYNDVDFGLRIRQAGLQVVYTPYAELFHDEGSTRRGWEDDADGPAFDARWKPRELVDPYYSPVFERDRPFVIAS